MARSFDAMSCLSSFLVLALFSLPSFALQWSSDQVGWNLNENATATDPLEYWGQWDNHSYNPSPRNWRFPFYMLTLDRYVDGDPTNNDANGTVFENDWMTNQFRFGGDVRGLLNHLDYIQGIGIRAIYLSGSPFINMPWASDGFGPLDFTLLDHHHGMIDDWRALVNEMHSRDMYLILDNTVGTMGDLMAFEGWENLTTPFNSGEYDVVWKTDRRYHDFAVGNDVNESCEYPVFWDNSGYPYGASTTDQFHGCRISDFDQYGDMQGVGYVPPYQTQLSKFASVQDRLRLWKRDVLEKVMHFSCMQIAMLDIDGFRVDKALQTPLAELAEWATYQRECARRYGKENFLVVGEAVGELNFSSTFYGRGKSPDMYFTNVTKAQLASNASDAASYIRETGNSALDGAAFHYPTYGAMTRFLGLDGAIGFEGVDFADHWNQYLLSNDMVNSQTGEFDPRHMFGMTNQDVFRWPSLANGTQRQTLGLFITMLEMPGIPMIMWGEEQEYKVLENLAADYIFGRQPMTSTRAWQLHGCYKVGAAGNGYYDMPFDSALEACHDDSVSLDQRDPSNPLRNLLKRMFELRSVYPVLNDGYTLQTLFFHTHDIFLPHSGQLPTPLGIWSVYRGRTPGVQDLSGSGQGNQGIWLMYQNQNKTVEYSFDCSNATGSLIAPFPHGTTVKNLFYPYEEYTLNSSTTKLGIEDSDEINGCLPSIELEPWAYKAFVPIDKFVPPAPVITMVTPRHDARIETSIGLEEVQTVPIELQFSREMDCGSITKGITTSSTTSTGLVPQLNASSVVCQNVTGAPSRFVGEIGSTFSWRGTLVNVSHGVHTFTVSNVSTADGLNSTNSKDRFMFRIGASDNPIIFPLTANYTTNLLHQDSSSGQLYVTPKAVGADMWRYSTNWGSSYSNWTAYTGKSTNIEPQVWSGTTDQEWEGVHVITQYWSNLTGSTDHVQHSDLESAAPRRWPHIHVQGSWNEFGYDGGLDDNMHLQNGLWMFDLASEWPTSVILNVWGMNPDGSPDKSAAFGDVDGDGVLDWVPPDSLAFNEINITSSPPFPYIAQRIIANDGDYSYNIQPVGSASRQIAIYILLALASIICAFLATCAFAWSFYRLKVNTVGLSKRNYPFDQFEKSGWSSLLPTFIRGKAEKQLALRERPDNVLATTAQAPNPRTVLIATMEYEIKDWAIKIKIGGLGVMASLMGNNLGHQNLIWVVPCVGDVEYPTDQVAEPMTVFVMGKPYEVQVQYHTVGNITYVLLDAPVFRDQTKAEPYPARMDDMDSAIYYSAWNACIAETIKRFPEIDLYHINDYHGAVAPLHLLPRVIPCCLSLHNAEFQGLWSINTPERLQEISNVFNLDKKIVKKYVQWGEVFNLLHAGASYLRIHQKGFGAAGVSKKYGKRSFARYPIFWGLQKVGALPNPDPSDTAEWDKKLPDPNVTIDKGYESKRGILRKQAQEWAGLNVDENAELFVFVGRWSMQKGVDVIADVFPAILKEKPNTQLICIGPVIDLYGRFAALKLSKLMEMYPGRVFSKPEFTALPPFIFSGAEFALIPSRDEPFGLVAVEFGRKGALGVGARVGGLGQMPGWWFTIESVTTKHMITQFKSAIKSALASSQETRALMRARSSVQRFPVAQWVEDLEILQSTSIKISEKVQGGTSAANISVPGTALHSPADTAPQSVAPSIPGTAPNSEPTSRAGSRGGSRVQSRSGSPTRSPQADVSSRLHSAILARRLASIRKSPTALSLDQMATGDLEANGGGLYPIRSQDPNNQLDAVGENETRQEEHLMTPSSPSSPIDSALPSGAATPAPRHSSNYPYQSNPGTRPNSTLSVNEVVGDQKDFKLQDVDPSFTDPTGAYSRMFEQMLVDLNPKNSEGKLCIEEFLHKSEKNWFNRFHEVKLGKSAPSSPTPSLYRKSWRKSTAREPDVSDESSASSHFSDNDQSQFQLSEKHTPPTGIAKMLQLKIGDWPVYSLLLALGQILAANSYQITLITGAVGETATKLYVVACIYLAGSLMWWYLFRRVASRWVLSLPFFAYGLAFFLLGLVPYSTTADARGWIQNVATGIYALASSAGSLFFALNFGSEGGTPVRAWIFRACTVQGTQQIYVTVLWYWGAYLTSASASGVQATQLFTYTPGITAVTTPVAVVLWAVSALLFVGLPGYYRASPGSVPSFYRSMATRKIVLWFFVAVAIQNYWLSAPYGRNWRYLWSSTAAPAWSVALLVLLFFGGVWAALLWLLGRRSAQHSWFVPVFAMGLGAPRWAQMLWGVSGVGAFLPWSASSAAAGALAARALWLWLGVLDALQGVGFGMVLLQTLTRFHVAFALVAAQVVGSIATIAARASAPDATGPGSVFPNLGVSLDGLGSAWFWVALGFQMLVPVGFFMFFRKEQLFKP